MTITEAKAYNDAEIRDQTEDLSISTDEVATAIDQAMDAATLKGPDDPEATSSLDLTFTGSATWGANGNAVEILTPVNAGYVKLIQLDQPNVKILMKRGNQDAGASLQRVAINNGEFRITSGATVDGSSNPLDGFITLYCNTTEVARLLVTGIRFPLNGTPGIGKVPTGTDSSGNWSWQTPSEGGGPVDESFVPLDDEATIDIDFTAGKNFEVEITATRNITVSNVVEGKMLLLKVQQDPDGDHKLIFPVGTKIAHGQATGTTFNLSPGGDQIDFINIWHDGTSLYAVAAFNFHS